jgi:uridylate kinase
MKENIVIKLGGSLLFTEDFKINSQRIENFCNLVKNRIHSGNTVIICGGGIIAREYIKAVRSFNGSEALCDIFGIELSRINSKLLISSFQELAFPIVPKTIEELSTALLFNKIVVMGGLQPGQSTTSVALEVAEYINAKELVILTNVKGIYDKDPKQFDDARMFEHITYDKLQDLIIETSGNKQATAGEYRVFDAVSLQILKRSNIKVIVISGEESNDFKNYLAGNVKLSGTIISKD